MNDEGVYAVYYFHVKRPDVVQSYDSDVTS